MAKKKKNIEYYGTVMGSQVPMIITFDENHVEYIAKHLGEAIERAYEIFDFFGVEDQGSDPFE
jgi:hypothetical protein